MARQTRRHETQKIDALPPLVPHYNFQFARYLPLLDPDVFDELGFYQELERIGYKQILLGGTGAADLSGLCRAIKENTSLQVVLYPAGPDSLAPADLVVLPDVMNSNSHYARPFGTGSVVTALNVAARKLPFIPVAYFIMGNSTARWYFDAFSVPSFKLIMGYALYAQMLGYRYLALDFEDPETPCDAELIGMLRKKTDLKLVVSDELDPEGARQALDWGVHTIITPSDVLEEAADPLALARAYAEALLRD